MFIAKCSDPAKPIFDYVRSRAREDGHAIHWEGEGFSLRAITPGKKTYFTFIFCAPSNIIYFYFSRFMSIPQDKEPVCGKDS
jgi:hypothetical protein